MRFDNLNMKRYKNKLDKILENKESIEIQSQEENKNMEEDVM
jgi:hypothetical protein